MKFLQHIVLAIAAFSGCTFLANAQSPKLENSLLWKVEGKNAKTSYLFGTIHLISEADFFMPEKVTKAFSASQKLVMEIDISNEDEVMSILQYSNMRGDTTLTDLFTEADYALLDSTMKVLTGMSVADLNTFKPFVLESFLIQNMIEGTTESYEMVFAEMAQSAEKTIDGLESVKEQMALFDELPYQEQADDLMKYVRGDEDMKKLFAEMVVLYKAQNISALYGTTEGYFPDEIWMQKLLFERNAKWIPILEKQMQENSVFVAVGAGHLGGEKGVINLLRKAGYKVTAVK